MIYPHYAPNRASTPPPGAHSGPRVMPDETNLHSDADIASAVAPIIEEPGLTPLRLGFIPLTDCAPLVIAHERWLFRRHGLSVTLSRERSWATIRDKVAAGILDAAHMLAGIPLASTLGLTGAGQPMVAALSLGLSGNAITVSDELHARLLKTDPDAMARRPVAADALKTLIDRDRAAGQPPMTFATVFPFSSHHYQLRYWMAAAGIDPDRDVELMVVPPADMVDRLAAGEIAGCCVGEPWNSYAVRRGIGHALITSYELWNNNPEKVLGVTRAWAQKNPQTHAALIRALLEATAWLDEPEHRAQAAELLAQPEYVGAPAEVIAMSLTGTFQYHPTGDAHALADFNVFHRYAANFPWRSHALWFLAQMARWGQFTPTSDDPAAELHAIADAVYDPEIYRAAAADLGIPYPTIDHKTEGNRRGPWTLTEATRPIPMGPDRFFDAGRFDPVHPLAGLDLPMASR